MNYPHLQTVIFCRKYNKDRLNLWVAVPKFLLLQKYIHNEIVRSVLLPPTKTFRYRNSDLTLPALVPKSYFFVC